MYFSDFVATIKCFRVQRGIVLQPRIAQASETRYVLAKCIARGGMAEIFLGKQIGKDGFQRLCAIKRILPHFGQDSEFIEMFRDEAHICKRLQHANIVRVEGFEEVEGSYAIIMEFVDGADLRSLLAACEKANCQLSVPMAVFVIAETARGLHYAHTKVDEVTNKPLEIVHRDISPQNILISYEGEVKVTDFGIADADNKMTDTKPGVVKGKYSYMSPEQINAKQVDARSDVFALGIVLWEILAMRRLFQGENEVMTINLVRKCEIPTPLSSINPKVDEELESIILKALEKDRTKRFQSAEELERRLRVYLSKKYPGYTPSLLAQLIKEVLVNKRNEIQAEIKKVLTSVNQKSALRRLNDSQEKSASNFPTSQSSKSLHSQVPQNSIIPLGNTHGGRSKIHAKPGVAKDPSSRRLQNSNALKYSTKTQARQKSLAWVLYFLVFMLVSVGVVMYEAWQQISTAKHASSLQIHTLPSSVKIKINDQWMQKGRYIQTPTSFRLEAGDHRIQFIRDGYAPFLSSINAKNTGGKINLDNVVLKRKDRLAPTRITSQQKTSANSVYVEIDEGRDVGFLPLLIRDTIFGTIHLAKIYPNYPKSQQDFFTCQFKSNSNNLDNPFNLTVDLKKRSCRGSVK